MKISIIIPAFNEEKTIGSVIEKLQDIKIDAKKQILVVDDGSEDRTAEIAGRFKGVKIVRHAQNLGKGAAIKSGIEKSDGDVILIQDADMEYQPKHIPDMLREIMKGENVVYGSRFKGKIREMSFLHLFGNLVLTLLSSLLFGHFISDMETGYKMFRRSALKGEIKSSGFEVEAELTSKFIKGGNRIKEIPIEYNARKKREKKISWKDGVRTAELMFRIRALDIADFFAKNRLILFLFLFSTMFFIYQHSTGLSWDFSAYVLNARHLFSGGAYFEWYRPPLISFIIGLFGGGLASEYAYIILVSALFLHSSVKFSHTFGFDRKIFYALMLNPFVLISGFSAGAELLSLSLVMLSLAFYFSSRAKSSAALSLAFLARYTDIIFLPLMLLSRKPKKVLLPILVFAAFLSPWLLYNYVASGSPLASIADSYLLNVRFKGYMFMQFDIWHLLVAGNFLLVLFSLGIAAKAKKISKKDVLMLSIIPLALLSYYMVPFKEPRYLFILALPLAYFSYFALRRHRSSAYILVAISVASVVSILILSPNDASLDSSESYAKAVGDAGDCAVASNAWVYLNYYGLPSENAPREPALEKRIKEGYRVILFRNVAEPDYARNKTVVGALPVIKDAGNYIILGNRSACAPREKQALDRTYLQNLNRFLSETYNYTEEGSPCRILLPKFAGAFCKVFE